MEPLSNISSHNSRINQIRKFCAVPPARGVLLRLVTAEDPPAVLGEWTREEASGNGSLAIEADSLLTEHCQTVQRDVEALIAWTDEHGMSVVSKRLRMRHTWSDDGDAQTVQSEALGITGQTIGQVVQAQRHLEVMTKSYMTAHHAQMQTALQLQAQLGSQLAEAYSRIDELQASRLEEAERRRVELQELVIEEPDAPVSGEPRTPEEEAQAELYRTANTVIQQAIPLVLPVLVQHLQRFLSPPEPPQLRAISRPRPPAPGGPAAAAAAVPKADNDNGNGGGT